jgi:AbrB family looped-hinge helix DNA binding protein
MATSSVKVSSKNKISLPKQACNQLKIKAGDRFLLDIQDGLMVLLPFHETFMHALAGLNHNIWRDSEGYILHE